MSDSRFENLQNSIRQCQCCSLCHKIPKDTTPVPFTGNPKAKLLILGEAPGKTEQEMGEPFQGTCGQLLNKMLIDAGLDRNQDVCIDNVVKCLPLNGNKCRPPTQMEIFSCKPWWTTLIMHMNPVVIMTLGKTATSAVVGSQLAKNYRLDDVVGKTFQYTDDRGGVMIDTIVVPNYHPSFLMQYGRKYTMKATEIIKQARDIAYEQSLQRYQDRRGS